MKNLRYSELQHLLTFEERFEYLSLNGIVGESTFGFDRLLNQRFYTSPAWKAVRYRVILRDNGCDLGIPGYEIFENLMIHHINPMTPDDIKHGEEWILDPEYLITTSRQTHNAIHFGDSNLLSRGPIERTPGDTRLW